jgi:hypothetical protein
VLGRSLEPGSTILVSRKNEEEVDISVIPPSPPAEKVAVTTGEGDEPASDDAAPAESE